MCRAGGGSSPPVVAVGYGEDVATRVAALAGIAPATATIWWEKFLTPTGTNFGERWSRTCGSVGTVNHNTVLPGGWARLFNSSGLFETYSLVATGPGVVNDGATEKWGVVFRVRCTLLYPGDAQSVVYFGLNNDAESAATLFGLFVSASAVFCDLAIAGGLPAVNTLSSYTVANLGADIVREIMIISKNRLVTVYVDGTAVVSASSAGGLLNRKPVLYLNKGDVSISDVIMVTEG
jgi:hypothetical protein